MILSYLVLPTKAIAVTVILFILAIACKPIRRAVGVAIVVVGVLECLTGIGIIIGLPTIFFVALFLFI